MTLVMKLKSQKIQVFWRFAKISACKIFLWYGIMQHHYSVTMTIFPYCTSKVWFVRGGDPEHMVVLQQVSAVEHIRDEESGILGQVAKGNVGIASLLQLVLWRSGQVRLWHISIHGTTVWIHDIATTLPPCTQERTMEFHGTRIMACIVPIHNLEP